MPRPTSNTIFQWLYILGLNTVYWVETAVEIFYRYLLVLCRRPTSRANFQRLQILKIALYSGLGRTRIHVLVWQGYEKMYV